MTMFYFYNPVIYQNENKTPLNLKDILDRINNDLWSSESNRNNNWIRRVRVIDDKIATIFEPIRTSYTNNDITIIPMGEFIIKDKPYTAELVENTFEKLSKSIVEICTFVNRRNDYLLVLEYNHNGLKKNDIEKYFNTYLPDDFKLYLEPIIKKQTRDIINETNQITEFNIEIDTNIYDESNIQNHINNTRDTNYIYRLLNSIKSLIDDSQSFDMDEFSLKYKVENQNKTMNLEMIRSFIDIINIEDDSLRKLELYYKNPDTNKRDSIDLKNLEIDLKYKANFNTKDPAPPFIGDTVIRDLNNFNSDIDKSYNSLILDMDTSINFPDLYFKPREEHSVENLDSYLNSTDE